MPRIDDTMGLSGFRDSTKGSDTQNQKKTGVREAHRSPHA
jgi:hypothetical protein